MKSFSDLGNYVSSELVANLAILVCTNPRWRLPSGIWIPNGRVATAHHASCDEWTRSGYLALERRDGRIPFLSQSNCPQK